jgi:hypothetical protein
MLDPAEYRELPTFVHEYDTAGREVTRRTLPPIAYPQASYGLALFGLATPMTEAGVLVGTSQYLRGHAREEGGMRKPILLHQLDNAKYYIPGTAPQKSPPSGLVPGYLTLMLLSAGAGAVGCFLLARRHAFSRARCMGWMLMGFLFGWIGLALILIVEEWPARVACPKCRKRRVVTRELCEHCGAPHAGPASDGTEIFEESAAAPGTALVAH